MQTRNRQNSWEVNSGQNKQPSTLNKAEVWQHSCCLKAYHICKTQAQKPFEKSRQYAANTVFVQRATFEENLTKSALFKRAQILVSKKPLNKALKLEERERDKERNISKWIVNGMKKSLQKAVKPSWIAILTANALLATKYIHISIHSFIAAKQKY